MRILWIAVSLVVASLFVLPVVTAAAETVPPGPRDEGVEPGERLDVLVERIRFENARRHSLEASFVQLKESALLLEPLRAEGEFSYEAPDKARWEYHSPDPISLVIDGQEMLTWYRDLGLVERYQVGRHSEKVLDYLGASSSIGTLL
ncbi:MAG: outer membrane lipoprotein carrier protein LolA, partial [Thermoanaerobaculia bacterium]|nr:outer membrane lipoprotein carrier protein LolA [Thermoanaerobaculia bacterium]